jgi:adenylate cyclase class IV
MPSRNIELKARLADMAQARKIARRMASAYLGIEEQTDTYLQCRHGRMKLREIRSVAGATQQASLAPPDTGVCAQLIWYERPDETDAKGSDYILVEVSTERALQLRAEMGIQITVCKRREIFLCENVRIHLDEVVGLGSFLEFEAVLDENMDDALGHAQIAKLQAEFGIGRKDLVAGSYADLLGGASASTVWPV